MEPEQSWVQDREVDHPVAGTNACLKLHISNPPFPSISPPRSGGFMKGDQGGDREARFHGLEHSRIRAQGLAVHMPVSCLG